MASAPDSPAEPHGLVAQPGPELVFGLIGAVGTDLSLVGQILTQHLERVNYTCYEIRVSSLLHSLDRYQHLSAQTASEYQRISEHMQAGSELRRLSGRGDVLALMAVSRIRLLRKEHGSSGDELQPLPRTAYIIRSLKHPAEVSALRDIYGRAFFLVSAYSPRAKRVSSLSQLIAESEGSPDHARFRKGAEELINTDEEEGAPLGQSVRESFPQGDVFVDARARDRLEESIERFVTAIFGNPFITPAPDEFGMFHANSAALRSADLSRQVGAAIAADGGNIIALGCNDVPRAGGGLYWPGDDPDVRDFQQGFDSAAKFRDKMISELSAKLIETRWTPPEGWPKDGQAVADRLMSDGVFRGTRLQNLLEYGRAVHAEMAAITDAALRGVSTRAGTLYSTTFPCHLCARHIIAAGITRVVYVEPYPKSVAEELYSDSMTVDAEERSEKKVAFEPFIGIAASIYPLVFRPLSEARKDGRGKAKVWQPAKAEPKLKRFVSSYLLIENEVLGSVLPRCFSRANVKPVRS